MQKVLFSQSALFFFDDRHFTNTEIRLLADEMFEKSENNLGKRFDDFHLRGSGDSFSGLRLADKLIIVLTDQVSDTDIMNGSDYLSEYGDSDPVYILNGSNWTKVAPERVKAL